MSQRYQCWSESEDYMEVFGDSPLGINPTMYFGCHWVSTSDECRSVVLDRKNVQALYEQLGQWLKDTNEQKL